MPKTEYLHVPGVTLIDNEILSYKGKYYDIHEIQDYLSGRYEEDTPIISMDSFKNWMNTHKFEIYDAFSIVDDILYERTEKMNLEEKLHALSESELFKLVYQYCEDNRYAPILINEGDPYVLGNDVRKSYSVDDKYISIDGYGYVYSFNDLFDKASETDLANYLNSTSKFDYLFDDDEPEVSLDDSSVADADYIKKLKKLVSQELEIKYSTIAKMVEEIDKKYNFKNNFSTPFFTKFSELKKHKADASRESWREDFANDIKGFKKDFAEAKLPEKSKAKYVSSFVEGKTSYDKLISIIEEHEKNVEAEKERTEGTNEDLSKYITKVSHYSDWAKREGDECDLYRKLMKLFDEGKCTYEEARTFAYQISIGKTDKLNSKLEAIKEKEERELGTFEESEGEGDEIVKAECETIIKEAIEFPSDYDLSWQTYLKEEVGLTASYIKSIEDFIVLVQKGERSQENLKRACKRLTELVKSKKVKYVKGRKEYLNLLDETLKKYNFDESVINDIHDEMYTKITNKTVPINKKFITDLLENLLAYASKKDTSTGKGKYIESLKTNSNFVKLIFSYSTKSISKATLRNFWLEAKKLVDGTSTSSSTESSSDKSEDEISE